MVIDFRTFFDVSQQMERMLSDFGQPSMISQRGLSYPPLNVSEDDSAIHVRAEIPGVDRNALELTLTDRTLSIKGEIKAEKGKFYRQERPVGPFQRIVNLASRVDQAGIKATMHDGVLHVTLPKAEEEKPRAISIGGGQEEVGQ